MSDDIMRYRGAVPRQRTIQKEQRRVAVQSIATTPLCFQSDNVTIVPGGSYLLASWISPESGTLRSVAIHLLGLRGIGELRAVSTLVPDETGIVVDTGVTTVPDVPVAQFQAVELSILNTSEETIYIKHMAVTAMFVQ